MRFLNAGVIAGLLLTSGCANKPNLECTTSSSTSTMIDLFKSELEKAVTKQLTSDDGILKVSHSSIRSSIAQLIVSIDDIRTSKVDPNSTKKFCAGTLDVKVPVSMISDADAARSEASQSTISALADAKTVDREADRFTIPIQYDVQPTDDGDKVFAETEDTNKLTNFFDELVAYALLKSGLEQTKAAAQQQQQQVAQAQQAAVDTQKKADQDQAKTENQLANQTINAVWRNLPDPIRAQMLADQRAWNAKKIADCNVVAAGASTDPMQQETARLQCDTKATQERTQQLQSGAIAQGLQTPSM